jgi:hypothetical protein
MNPNPTLQYLAKFGPSQAITYSLEALEEVPRLAQQVMGDLLVWSEDKI